MIRRLPAVAAVVVVLALAVWMSRIRELASFGTPEQRGGRVVGTSIYSEDGSLAVIMSHVERAAEMRFGNTLQEMKLASWEPYRNERVWYLPGFGYQTQPIVHAQYRSPQLGVVEIQMPVFPAAAAEAPDGKTFPLIHIPDPRVSDDTVVHSFDAWHERWATYQDAYGRGNVFFPMTHQPTGGVGDGGFIWTDASRWLVDPPETPHSILVALNYWRWMFPPEWRTRTGLGDSVDVSNAVLEVALRGRELDLGSARVTFWILCGGARWHMAEPLGVANGRWVANRVMLAPEPNQWELSWARASERAASERAALCLDRVESYGFAFRGFERGRTPTGVLDLDEFKLTKKKAGRRNPTTVDGRTPAS